MKQFHSRSRFYLQCLGAILLAAALLLKHPAFDFIWFLFALLVAIGLPLLNVWITAVFETVIRRNREPRNAVPDYHRAQKYFLAMEDGIFLVPLLWIGINPLTAGIASVLYALFAFRQHSISMVITRSAAYFVLIIWVLPNGLCMGVAKWIVDGGRSACRRRVCYPLFVPFLVLRGSRHPAGRCALALTHSCDCGK